MNVDVKFLENLIECTERKRCGQSCLIEAQVNQLRRLVEVENKKIQKKIVHKGLNLGRSKS